MRAWYGVVAVAAAAVGLFAVAAALLQQQGASAAELAFPAAGLPALCLGPLVARRQATVGLLATLVGAAPIADACVVAWATSGLPGAPSATSVADGSWTWQYAPPVLLALVFPTGRLRSGRWRPVAAAAVAVPLAFTALAVLASALPEAVAGLGTVTLLAALLGCLVAAVVSVVARYRQGDETDRRRIRWFAATSVLLPAALVVCWVEFLLVDSTVLVGVFLALLFVLLPASVAVAMLRHELYGVDRLLAGTVRWAVLVTAAGALFAVLVVIAGSVLGSDGPAAAAAAVGALLVARPLHAAVRREVDRRFQPRRQRALAAIDRQVGAVRSGGAPEGLEEAMREALGDPALRISDDGIRPGLVPLTARDLADLDAASVLPRELVRLRRDLREALTATAASRGRILEAADDERARIERDLHDGAQQQLVAVGMRLRSLERSAPDSLRPELGEAVRMVQDSIAELRRLAQGIRPAALDDGLGAALRSMVRSLPLQVDLAIDPEPVPEPAATTAYYVAAEAVTNALKHSGARRIRIALARQPEGLRLEVGDDGRGGAVERPGGGLAGLADRLDALGGRITVEAGAEGGTLVTAVLP